MKNICVFCYSLFSIDDHICYTCKDYDGVMPLNLDTLNYLGEDPADWQEDLVA